MTCLTEHLCAYVYTAGYYMITPSARDSLGRVCMYRSVRSLVRSSSVAVFFCIVLITRAVRDLSRDSLGRVYVYISMRSLVLYCMHTPFVCDSSLYVPNVPKNISDSECIYANQSRAFGLRVLRACARAGV